MKRTVEPELMLDSDQCRQYSLAPKDIFINIMQENLPRNIGTHVADLGCGPGDFTNHLLNEFEDVVIDAYDGSTKMIEIAKSTTSAHSDRVNFYHGDITALENTVQYDFVICTNTLHHIHKPNELWKSITGLSDHFLVLDLVRPHSETELEETLLPYKEVANPIFLEDFRNSLCAAFSLPELQKQTQHLDCEIKVVDNFLGHSSQLAVIKNYG